MNKSESGIIGGSNFGADTWLSLCFSFFFFSNLWDLYMSIGREVPSACIYRRL